MTREGDGRGKTNAYISGENFGKNGKPLDVGIDIFGRVCVCPVIIR